MTSSSTSPIASIISWRAMVAVARSSAGTSSSLNAAPMLSSAHSTSRMRIRSTTPRNSSSSAFGI